jgi:hypothetical protein
LVSPAWSAALRPDAEPELEDAGVEPDELELLELQAAASDSKVRAASRDA